VSFYIVSCSVFLIVVFIVSFTDYLEPLLYELSPLAGYTVKSQWLYFVTLNVQPKLVIDSSGSGHQHYALAEDILPQIITPLEKKLGMLVCVYQYSSVFLRPFSGNKRSFGTDMFERIL
jgi:hypothetical protein